MKLSVSSYSFQQYIGAGKLTQLSCIEKAKEMGFEAIEFTGLNGDTLDAQKEYAKQLRAEADRLGMTINAYTIGASLYYEDPAESEAEVNRLKGQLEVAKILGAEVMRHDVCWQLGKRGSARSFDLMLPTIAANARAVTEYAQTLGIQTCSENHGFIAQDSDRLERLFNAVNHDNYGLLVDMGNFLCVDEDPVLAVSRVAPYAIHVHAKDMLVTDKPFGPSNIVTRGCNYLTCTAIGEGNVPVEQCLRILKKAGYNGFVSIEYEGREDCIEGITKGQVLLNQIFAKLN